MGGRWQHWHDAIPYLAQHGRVLAVDLPGFGLSRIPAGGVSLDGYADTAAALCREVDVEQAVVLGHSMGGPIALRFATRHEDLTEAIVLVAGATDTFNAVLGLRETAKLALQKPTKTAATLTEVLTVGIRTPRALQRLIVARPWLRQALLWPYLHRPRAILADSLESMLGGSGTRGGVPRRSCDRSLRSTPGTHRRAMPDPLDRRPSRSHLPARRHRSLGRADAKGQNRPSGGMRAHVDARATASLQRAGRTFPVLTASKLSELDDLGHHHPGCWNLVQLATPGVLCPISCRAWTSP